MIIDNKKADDIFVKTDGTITEVVPDNGTDFQLKELQGFVGGYIEIVYIDNDNIAVVNEEGILLGLEQNLVASVLCHTHIVGNVLICKSSMVK